MTRQQNRSARRSMRGGIKQLYPSSDGGGVATRPYQGGSRRRRSMRGGVLGELPEQGGSRGRRSMRGGERAIVPPVLGGSIRRRSMRGGWLRYGGPRVA